MGRYFPPPLPARSATRLPGPTACLTCLPDLTDRPARPTDRLLTLPPDRGDRLPEPSDRP